MKYFRVQQDFRGSPQLLIRGLMSVPDYSKILQGNILSLPDAITLPVDSNRNNVYPDILTDPLFMVKEEIYDLIILLNGDQEYRNIFLSDYTNAEQHFYYAMQLVELDCLIDNKSKIMNQNTEKAISIRSSKWYPDIFRAKPVDGSAERIIIVSLPLAEAMVRRKPSRIRFSRVEIECEDVR